MRFLKAFAMSFILIVIFVFFGGSLLMNGWGLMAVAAVVIAILATIFMSMSDEIEELKKKLDALEGAGKTQEEGEGQKALSEEVTNEYNSGKDE